LGKFQQTEWNLSNMGQLHAILVKVRNVSINWKSLGKFQQTKLTLAKRQ